MNKLIGLIDVDGHAKKKLWGGTIHPNIALGKLSRWHKMQGDTVEWAQPVQGCVQLDLFDQSACHEQKVYDIIYALTKTFFFAFVMSTVSSDCLFQGRSSSQSI